MLARVFRRATAGRIATVAGSAVLTGGLLTDSVIAPGIAASVVTAGLGLATSIKILRTPGAIRTVAITVYAAPHAGAGAVLVGEALAPDSGPSLLAQTACVALWTASTWWIRPGQLARRLATEAEAQEVADANSLDETAVVVLDVPDEPLSPAARWWAQDIAERGIAPGTVLLEHQRLSDDCVAAIIGAAQRGTPVPKISAEHLSAHLDMPQELIEIGPVPGRGAGVCLLIIGPRPKPGPEETVTDTRDEDREIWAEIAKGAMPGVELIEATTYEFREELTQ